MNMNTPSTYQELFEDPATDPCRARADDNPAEALTALYARWRVGLAGVPERLYNDILVDFDALVGGIGFFVQDPKSPGGVLKVGHGFRRFTGALARPSPHRGKT